MQELETNSALVSSVWPLNSWRGRVSAVLSCVVAGFVIGFLGGTFELSAQTTGAMIMVVAGIPALGSLRVARMMDRRSSYRVSGQRLCLADQDQGRAAADLQ